MKLNNILMLLENLKKINPKEVNTRTAYWQARNIRNFNTFAEQFENDRKKILSDGWFIEYTELQKENESKANEQYKEELELATKEINELLEKEVEVTPFLINVEDYNGPSELIFSIFDLISD